MSIEIHIHNISEITNSVLEGAGDRWFCPLGIQTDQGRVVMYLDNPEQMRAIASRINEAAAELAAKKIEVAS